MEGTFQRRLLWWTSRLSSWDLQEQSLCSPTFDRDIRSWQMSLQRGLFPSSYTASNSWNTVDGFHGLFFLLVWNIQEYFAVAMGRRRVEAVQINIDSVRWSQQVTLKCAMSHTEAEEGMRRPCVCHKGYVLCCFAWQRQKPHKKSIA